MRCTEYHARRASSFKRFLPSSHAQTPAIAAFDTGKVELRNGRAEIVAGRGTEAKELLGHHRAHSVQPVISRTGAAVAIAIEAGARLATAAFKFASEYICGISHALILHRQSRFGRIRDLIEHEVPKENVLRRRRQDFRRVRESGNCRFHDGSPYRAGGIRTHDSPKHFHRFPSLY